MQISVTLPSGATVALEVDPAQSVADVLTQLRQHLLLDGAGDGTADLGPGRWVLANLGHPLADEGTLHDQGVTDGAVLDLRLDVTVADVAATATDATTVTVSWSAHESAVDGYTVRWSTDGGQTWSEPVTTRETTLTVPGLTAETEYLVEVDLGGGDGTAATTVTVATAALGSEGDGDGDGDGSGDGTGDGTGEGTEDGTGDGTGDGDETGTGEGTGDGTTDGTEQPPAPTDPADPVATPAPIVPVVTAPAVAAPAVVAVAPASQGQPVAEATATATAGTVTATAAPVTPPAAPAGTATMEIGLTTALLVAGVIAAARFAKS